MKLHRIILEAEQNVAKKKIDQYLSQLSDIDLVSLLPTLKESLSESAQDMMQQKREGRRIDGLPSDFVAYDDATKTAKRFKEEPNGLKITDVQYSPARQSNQTSAPEVKQIVNNLEKPEVEALADAVAKELDMRKIGQKQSPNTKSNPALLKKVLTALLAGGLLASAYGLGNVSGSSSSLEKIDQLQATIQQYEQSDLPNADAKIKELTSQIQTIQSTLDTTQSTLDTTSAKYDQEKTEWNKSDQDKLAKIDQLQAKIQQYEQSDLPNADAKIKELTNQIQTIQSTLDDTSAKYDQEKMDWEESKTELENQKAEAEKESAEYASQLSTLQKQEIARQNQELENIETRKSQKAEKDGDTVSLTPQQKLSLKLLKSGLKDPDSVKFSAVKLIKFDDGSELITGWMNAKNSFGGYTSGGMFLTTPTGLPNVGYDGKPSIWSGEGQWDRDSLKPWETPLVGIMADGQYKDIQSDRLRTVMELYMDPKAVAEFNAEKSTIKKGHQIDIDAIPKVISSEYISVDGSQLDEIRKLAGLN